MSTIEFQLSHDHLTITQIPFASGTQWTIDLNDPDYINEPERIGSTMFDPTCNVGFLAQFVHTWKWVRATAACAQPVA